MSPLLKVIEGHWKLWYRIHGEICDKEFERRETKASLFLRHIVA